MTIPCPECEAEREGLNKVCQNCGDLGKKNDKRHTEAAETVRAACSTDIPTTMVGRSRKLSSVLIGGVRAGSGAGAKTQAGPKRATTP